MHEVRLHWIWQQFLHGGIGVVSRYVYREEGGAGGGFEEDFEQFGRGRRCVVVVAVRRKERRWESKEA